MNNYSPDFNGLESQVMYRQAKFRQEASQANSLKMARMLNENQPGDSPASQQTNRPWVRSGNWVRKFFARLTHQANPTGI